MIKRMDKEILAKYHQGRQIVRKYHQGRLYYKIPWELTAATMQAIMAAFGVDGTAVIRATNEYLNGIAASDAAKATALAGFINEYVPGDVHVIYTFVPTLGYARRIYRTGGAYIDSGINPLVAPRCVADMIMNNHSDTDYWGKNDGGNSCYRADFVNGRLSYYRYGYPTTVDAGGYAAVGTRHIWDVGKQVLVDGILTYTSPYTYIYDSTTVNILIWRSGRYDSGANFTLYSFTIYDGETKVREFIPYYKNNVAGMLDLVNGVWYGNVNGSGSFTIEEVPTP